MRKRLVSLLVAAPVAALGLSAVTEPSLDAATAAKKRKAPVSKSKDLWATINVCDTEASPDTIGIRGSMPSLRRSKVLMRFQVQYLAKADGKWHNIASGADSGWVSLGRARNKVVESGQNFRFLPPADGGAHRLRGSVRFKWVSRKGKVLERERRFTEAGHRSTAGADPEGYSAAICDVT